MLAHNCRCSSSFLSLFTLNRKPVSSHPHAFLSPLPPTLLLLQKSDFYAIHRRQYFLHIGSCGGGDAAEKWQVSVVRGTVPVALNSGESGEDEENNGLAKAKSSRTSARGRRLLRVREEKRKREYDRIHNYPTWAKWFKRGVDEC